MPDFGIGELLATLGPALFAGGEAAAAPLALEGAAGAGLGGLDLGLGAAAGGLADAGGALAGGLGDFAGAAGAGAGVDLGAGSIAGGLAEAGIGAAPSLAELGFPAGADALGSFGAAAGPGATSLAPAAGGALDLSQLSGAALSGLPGGATTALPTAAAPAGLGAGAGGGGGFLSGLGDTLTGDLTSLVKSPAALAGLGGLGYSLYKGQQELPSTTDLKNELGQIQSQVAPLNAKADTLTQQGQGLIQQGQNQGQPLINQGTGLTAFEGTTNLPAGMQQQVDQSVKDAKTAIVSRYASAGQPTDPTKNSTLQSELQNADRQGQLLAEQFRQQLLQGGTGLINAGAGLQQGGVSGGTGLISSGNSLLNTGAQLSGLSTNLLGTLSNIDQKQTENIGKAIASFAAALSPNKPAIQIPLTR